LETLRQRHLYETALDIHDPDAKREMLISAFAYAAAENSASGAKKW
jgi:hypothetical protein